MSSDTIVALSTPVGRSSISVIRLSGEMSIKLANNLSRSKEPFVDRQAIFLPIYIESSEIIDEAIYTFFKAPASYTGEDIIEISCHGNPVIVGSVLDRLCHLGARMASPGEYTKRAFINGKMDLVQAESVGLLISAKSKDSAKHQMKNLSGALSRNISKIRDDLLFCLSELEYEFDVSENDTSIDDFLNKTLKLINNNIIVVGDLLGSYVKSRAYQRGIRVVICGETNAGKSTLMNALLGSNRSITSETAGTTRDTVTSDMVVGGVPITMVDTAGLRDPETPVEEDGVSRARVEISRSDLIISVYSCDTQRIDYKDDTPCLYVYNKVDIGHPRRGDKDAFPVSALCGSGIPGLWKKIEKTVLSISHTGSDVLVNTARQKESLRLCLDSMVNTKTCIENGSHELELAAFELKSAINSMDTFLGKITSQDVLEVVFSNFCVGK
jgi:tRNA modification GTPase